MNPLEGKIIITTQPADQAHTLLKMLKERGAKAFSLPMIETHTLKIPSLEFEKLIQPGRFELLVFTSKKGVKGFFENLFLHQKSYVLPEKLKIAVIGQGTADVLKKYRLTADYINPGTDARQLAAYLNKKITQPGTNVLLALGNKAPDFLEQALKAEATIKRINVYETLPIKEVDEKMAVWVREGKADMCLFTSPSGFYAFKDFFGNLESFQIAAIGATTASAIRESGGNVAVVASYPSPGALVIALEDYFIAKAKKT